MEGGFKDSPLKLNQGLGSCEVWNENSITERAEKLAEAAALVWPEPELSEDILQAYKPVSPEGARYSLNDHPHLQTGLTQELFEAFRVQVLALDECVNEEFLKLYVAYKAETNFSDVVPQAKGLLVILNHNFPEIDDPRGICRDITNLGRWGNGNVEVRLEKPEDMNYVIGLVRQALEKQLGEEGDSE